MFKSVFMVCLVISTIIVKKRRMEVFYESGKESVCRKKQIALDIIHPLEVQKIPYYKLSQKSLLKYAPHHIESKHFYESGKESVCRKKGTLCSKSKGIKGRNWKLSGN